MAPKGIPPGLESTYALLRSAYPKGIPEQEYFAVLRLLYDYMSHRGLAQVISLLGGKEYMEAYNDVGGCVTDLAPDEQTLQAVRGKLVAHGYDEWVKEE